MLGSVGAVWGRAHSISRPAQRSLLQDQPQPGPLEPLGGPGAEVAWPVRLDQQQVRVGQRVDVARLEQAAEGARITSSWWLKLGNFSIAVLDCRADQPEIERIGGLSGEQRARRAPAVGDC
jgi:hypothetical protein